MKKSGKVAVFHHGTNPTVLTVPWRLRQTKEGKGEGKGRGEGEEGWRMRWSGSCNPAGEQRKTADVEIKYSSKCAIDWISIIPMRLFAAKYFLKNPLLPLSRWSESIRSIGSGFLAALSGDALPQNPCSVFRRP